MPGQHRDSPRETGTSAVRQGRVSGYHPGMLASQTQPTALATPQPEPVKDAGPTPPAAMPRGGDRPDRAFQVAVAGWLREIGGRRR